MQMLFSESRHTPSGQREADGADDDASRGKGEGDSCSIRTVASIDAEEARLSEAEDATKIALAEGAERAEKASSKPDKTSARGGKDAHKAAAKGAAPPSEGGGSEGGAGGGEEGKRLRRPCQHAEGPGSYYSRL